MNLSRLVETSAAVAATRSRLTKVAHLRDLLKSASGPDIGLVTHYLSGELPQGRIGVGPALIRKVLPVAAADVSVLTLADLNVAFDTIAAISGSGANARRHAELEALLARALGEEQRFIVRLLVGEIRQGALEGVMVEAVAAAADLPAVAVRRALMISGSLPQVLRTALVGGVERLNEYRLELGRPVRPMLAQPSESLSQALQECESACVDVKMDGVRIQAHRQGDRVWLFTRAMHEVSRRLPEVVARLRSVNEQHFILDGEVIALNDQGQPLPFQDTMKRFGRKSDVESMAAAMPLSPVFFDVLHCAGEDLIDHPARCRFERLSEILPRDMVMPRVVDASPEEAETFLQTVLEQGHEGLMVKRLSSPYQAGSRGSDWLKIKPVHTLDLIVLAAEWGSGRREGWLSNLHLGARAGDADSTDSSQWVMLGKTFKGLSDEMLRWQTERLLELEVSRDKYVVHVRPELVVEVAFNEVQRSSNYASGMALRFARVKRFRHDKTPNDVEPAASLAALIRKS